MLRLGMDLTDSEYGAVEDSCEHGNEYLCSVQYGESLEWLCDISAFQELCCMELVKHFANCVLTS
jgi:hypothetical protein